MNSAKLQLLIISLFSLSAAFAQVPLTKERIAIGDSNNYLHGTSALTYSNGNLVMGSVLDNYLTFSNSGGTSNIQNEANSDFVFWTPASGGIRKMRLTNHGELRLGGYAVNPWAGSGFYNYKLMVDGAGHFTDNVEVRKLVTNASFAGNQYPSASNNSYTIEDSNVTNSAYHSAQMNVFETRPPSGPGQPTTLVVGGYQSAAQVNEAYLKNTNYTDMGASHIWSVQTNTFYPDSSTLSKYVNAYLRTKLGAGNSIGTYYTLYLESPQGQGSVSQISNYYGIYQESSAAKNYFAGKTTIADKTTIGVADNSAELTEYRLQVHGGIKARRVKVDVNSWADYVFDPAYKLPGLKEVEAFIKQNKHLPGVASEKELKEQGIDVAENQSVLLKKIEELTLYIIDLNKKLERQENEIKELKSKQ